MMTNKFLLAAIAMGLSVSVAQATENVAGGTINFTGMVTDATCTINGGNSASQSVMLEPISISQAGVAEGPIDAGKRAFTLTFSNCQSADSSIDPETDTIKLQFSSANTISNDGKYLINQENNTAGNPRNVGVTIVKQSAPSTPIPLNVSYDTAVTGGAAQGSASFYAKYYKVGTLAAEPGQVRTMVTYNVSYL